MLAHVPHVCVAWFSLLSIRTAVHSKEFRAQVRGAAFTSLRVLAYVVPVEVPCRMHASGIRSS